MSPDQTMGVAIAPMPDLASLPRGFAHPERDSQHAFRALLDAMANPGRVSSIVPAGFVGPDGPLGPLGPLGLSAAMACALQCLADPQTPIWLSARWRHVELITGFARFHCGCPFTEQADNAELAFIDSAELVGDDLTRWNMGTDLQPHLGTTLIIACDSLIANDSPAKGTELRLRGPGIEHETTMTLTGPPATFWLARQRMQDAFPRGLDLVFCAGNHVLALPRTTQLELA